jgi:hypothetical protein
MRAAGDQNRWTSATRLKWRLAGRVAENLLRSAREICPLLLTENEQTVFSTDLDKMLKRAEATDSPR